jgi:hypothetical protein
MYEAPDAMGEADVMGYGEPDIGTYAEAPAMEGYVRETEPAFSPRVVPADKLGGFDGYVTPKTTNPSCESFRSAEEVGRPSPQWFKSLW